MCEQVWYDVIHGLTPLVEPVPSLLKKDEDTDKYQSQIAEYEERLAKPDGVTPLLDFVCQAVRDRLELGAMAFYPRKTRGGGFYALEVIDAATIKPLTDVYGRDPLSPLPAYEQYLYGTPAGLYTLDDILYLRENRRTNSAYALSRVEMFLTRVNQALRKQSRDMARFTNGNLPDGLIELPAEIAMNWTPKDLADFREQWNAMYAGNDQARAGARIGMPGTKYTKIDDQPITTDFDRFCLTIACACFGVTMSDLSFTETVNRATAEAQRAITYKRTIHPTARVFEALFTWIIQVLLRDPRFRFRFKGYEDAEDFASLAKAHVDLVGSAIESPSDAAKVLKIPSKVDLPRMVITKDGPVVVDNYGRQDVQQKQLNDILAPPQPLPAVAQPTQQGDENHEENAQSQNTTNGSNSAKAGTPQPPHAQKGQSAVGSGAGSAGVKRAEGGSAPVQTGAMIAFMLTPETAKQLALPGGEPPEDMHVTLAYLGDMTDVIAADDHRLRAWQSPDLLKQALAAYVRLTLPLVGCTGGVGRFINEGDDVNPIWAGVNMPGLQKFRTGLVEYIESLGYFVANDFDFTPHITLAYVAANADMPVERVSVIPLVFDRLCLAIGGEQTCIEFGGHAVARASESSPVDTHWQTTDPLIQARLADMQKRGVKRLTWKSHPGCCDNCLMNDGQTVAVGHPFKSGALMEPEHNHCICETVEER